MAKSPSRISSAPIPDKLTLPALRTAAAGCKACDLWKLGTQTVFGEGRANARVMLVGEQPGDKEDLQGRPFVGPAGAVLDKALAAAGINRNDVYVTNIVKHFNGSRAVSVACIRNPTLWKSAHAVPGWMPKSKWLSLKSWFCWAQPQHRASWEGSFG